MLRENYSLTPMNELELVSIHNFAFKEVCDLISDEVEFFFLNKAYLVDVFVEGLDYKQINQKYLQDRFGKIIYSSKDMVAFIERLEAKILKELARISIDIRMDLKNSLADLIHARTSFIDLEEYTRTYALSCFAEKVVDKAWKKSCSRFIPPVLNKVSNKLKAGEFFMSSVGLTPKDVQCSIAAKIKKCLQGVMKHKKNELTLALRNEVLAQLLVNEDLIKEKNFVGDFVKTA